MITSTQNNSPRAPHDSKCGSALIIAVIFSAIVTLGIAGLLPMMLNDWKAGARTSAQEAAFSLAECAVDEAIWAVLEFGQEDDDWIDAGWAEDANNQNYWYKEWTLAKVTSELSEDYNLDEDRVGKYRVIVEKVTGSSVDIVSQGVVTGGTGVPDGFEVKRYIETSFDNGKVNLNGLIARDDLAFAGQPTFNSFNSTDIIGSLGSFFFDPAYATNNVLVGSVSTNVGKLSMGNAWVYGDIASGSVDDGYTDPSTGIKFHSGDMIWELEMDFPVIPKPTGHESWSSL